MTQGQSRGEEPIRSPHDRTHNIEQGPQQNTCSYEETVPKQVWNPLTDEGTVVQHVETGNRQSAQEAGASMEVSPAKGTDTQEDAVRQDSNSFDMSTYQSEEEPRYRPEARDEHQGGPARELPNLSSDHLGN